MTGMDSTLARPGDDNADTIFAIWSSMPGGVGGDVDDAGDVNGEYEGEDVSGVVGGVRYAAEGFGGLRGGNTGLGGNVDFLVNGRI